MIKSGPLSNNILIFGPLPIKIYIRELSQIQLKKKTLLRLINEDSSVYIWHEYISRN